MKFEKMNNGTLRCILTIEDLEENGIGMEDFFRNSQGARDFLQKIMHIAEDEVGFHANGNMMSIQAAIVSEEEIVLTFSEGQVSGAEFIEHLKSMLGGASSDLEAVTEKLIEKEDVFKALNTANEKEDEDYSYLLTFLNVTGAREFCSVLSETENIPSRLYYLNKKNQYFLWADLNGNDKGYVYEFVAASMEYAKHIEKDSSYRNYLEEHGKIIIKEQALETLARL